MQELEILVRCFMAKRQTAQESRDKPKQMCLYCSIYTSCHWRVPFFSVGESGNRVSGLQFLFRYQGCQSYANQWCKWCNDANHCPVQCSSVHSFGFAFCSASLTVPHSHTVRDGREGVKFWPLCYPCQNCKCLVVGALASQFSKCQPRYHVTNSNSSLPALRHVSTQA